MECTILVNYLYRQRASAIQQHIINEHFPNRILTIVHIKFEHVKCQNTVPTRCSLQHS